MSGRSPFEIALTADELAELRRRVTGFNRQYWVVMRAKMILLAAEGLGNDAIAARLGTKREVVSRWRKRFYYQRVAGLEGTPGKSRPERHFARDGPSA